ncbi:MAG: hypothetical protein ACI4EG_08455 [Fusicatenibacter sp.]
MDPYHVKDDDLKITSATDCTGLIPALPEDEEEIEFYEELYPYLPRPQETEEKNKH